MYKQLIIKTCKEYGLLRNQAAYVLATTEWETARTFEPVKEAYWLSEDWRKKNLRYYPWYGRGFVQLTWEENYKKAGTKIGVDLIKNPDAAMEPNNAAKILVLGMKEGWFTGKKLSDYITLRASDFRNARRIVNGLDKAAEIEKLAQKYDRELLSQGYGVEGGGDQLELPLESPEKPTEVGKGEQAGKGAIAIITLLIGAAIAFLFGGGL